MQHSGAIAATEVVQHTSPVPPRLSRSPGFRSPANGGALDGLGLTLGVLLLGGCGPTKQEIAVTLLTSVALVVPLAVAVNYGLYRLWRDASDVLAPTWVEAALVCAVTAALTLGVNTAVLAADSSLILFGIWLAGTSYLSFYSLALGAALWRRKRWVFRGLYWAPAAVAALFLMPIVVDVPHLPGVYEEAVFLVVMYAGGLGAVSGAFLVALLIVSVVVFRRARSAEGTDRPR